MRKDNSREPRDFQNPHIFDRFSNLLSRWGFLTSEREGRSHSRTTILDQGSAGFTTVHYSEETASHSLKSDQRLKITIANDKTETLQTSFDDYGKFDRILHYDDTNTVQLYKKVPVPEQTTSIAKSLQCRTLTRLRPTSTPNTIRELYIIKVFRHAQKELFQLPGLRQSQSRAVSLCHPNIVQIIDILYDKQTNICLVMLYCASGNLHSYLLQRGERRNDLSTEELNCWAIQILRAMGFLHQNGIAHGDLRPAHILLTG